MSQDAEEDDDDELEEQSGKKIKAWNFTLRLSTIYSCTTEKCV